MLIMKTKIKVGSLFAGVGGICLGLQQAQNEKYQFDLAWANEIDEYACETYRTNFNHALIEGDINLVLNPSLVSVKIEELEKMLSVNQEEKKQLKIKTDIQKLKKKLDEKYYERMHEIILSCKIDLLNGGFPCQAFSIAGEQKGFNDERGNLFLSIVELIKQLGEKYEKPRFLFLENVKNLKSHDKGNTYKVIKSKLEESGYTIKEHILNTMDYSDLPQNRERMYILGFLNKEDADKFTLFENLKEYVKKKNSLERAEDVKKVINYDEIVDSKYYYTKQKYPHYFIEKDEFVPSEKKAERINLEEAIKEFYQFYQLRRGMYVRKNKSDVCPTLTANMGTGGHNVPLILVKDGIRKMTPSETFKMQGFPIENGYVLPKKINGKDYADANLYKQAGNAVSVPIIKLIAEHILTLI